MATFDQALTESALIVIPLLIFLLGIGWAFGGGGGGGSGGKTPPSDRPRSNDDQNDNGDSARTKKQDDDDKKKKKRDDARKEREAKQKEDDKKKEDDAKKREDARQDEEKKEEEKKKEEEDKKKEDEAKAKEDGNTPDPNADGGINGNGYGGPDKTVTMIKMPDSADGTPTYAMITTPNTPGIGHKVDINVHDPNASSVISNAPSGLPGPTPPPATPFNRGPYGGGTPPPPPGGGGGYGGPPPGGGNGAGGGFGNRGAGAPNSPQSISPGAQGIQGKLKSTVRSPPPTPVAGGPGDASGNTNGWPMPNGVQNLGRGNAGLVPPQSAMPIGRTMQPLSPGLARSQVPPYGVPAGMGDSTPIGMPRGILKVPGESHSYQTKKPEGLTINNVNVMPRPEVIPAPHQQPFAAANPLHPDIPIGQRGAVPVSAGPKPLTFFPDVHITNSPEPVSATHGQGAARQNTLAVNNNGQWAPLKPVRAKTVRPDPLGVPNPAITVTYDPITGQYVKRPATVSTDEKAKAHPVALDEWLKDIPSPDKAAKERLLQTSPTKVAPNPVMNWVKDIPSPNKAAKAELLGTSPTKARPVALDNWLQDLPSPDKAAKARMLNLSPTTLANKEKVQQPTTETVSPEKANATLPTNQSVVKGKALQVGSDGKVREVGFVDDTQDPVDITLGAGQRPERKVQGDVAPLGVVEPEAQPGLIRVVDKDGKVIGVAKAPGLAAKVSPTDALAKAQLQNVEKVAPEPLKPVPSAEDEIQQDKELLKLREDLKAFDTKAEATPGQPSEVGDSEKLESLQEMRKKLEELKNAKRNEGWESVKADLDKAQNKIKERQAVRGEKPEPAGWEDISEVDAPRTRKDVPLAPEAAYQAEPEPAALKDTGIRRRKSALVKAESGGQTYRGPYVEAEEAEPEPYRAPPEPEAVSNDRARPAQSQVESVRGSRNKAAQGTVPPQNDAPVRREVADSQVAESEGDFGSNVAERSEAGNLRAPPSRVGRSVAATDGSAVSGRQELLDAGSNVSSLRDDAGSDRLEERASTRAPARRVKVDGGTSGAPKSMANVAKSVAGSDGPAEPEGFYDALERVDVWKNQMAKLHKAIDTDLSSISTDVQEQEEWLDERLAEGGMLSDQINSFPKNEQKSCLELSKGLQLAFQRQFAQINMTKTKPDTLGVKGKATIETGDGINPETIVPGDSVSVAGEKKVKVVQVKATARQEPIESDGITDRPVRPGSSVSVRDEGTEVGSRASVQESQDGESDMIKPETILPNDSVSQARCQREKKKVEAESEDADTVNPNESFSQVESDEEVESVAPTSVSKSKKRNQAKVERDLPEQLHHKAKSEVNGGSIVEKAESRVAAPQSEADSEAPSLAASPVSATKIDQSSKGKVGNGRADVAKAKAESSDVDDDFDEASTPVSSGLDDARSTVEKARPSDRSEVAGRSGREADVVSQKPAAGQKVGHAPPSDAGKGPRGSSQADAPSPARPEYSDDLYDDAPARPPSPKPASAARAPIEAHHLGGKPSNIGIQPPPRINVSGKPESGPRGYQAPVLANNEPLDPEVEDILERAYADVGARRASPVKGMVPRRSARVPGVAMAAGGPDGDDGRDGGDYFDDDPYGSGSGGGDNDLGERLPGRGAPNSQTVRVAAAHDIPLGPDPAELLGQTSSQIGAGSTIGPTGPNKKYKNPQTVKDAEHVERAIGGREPGADSAGQTVGGAKTWSALFQNRSNIYTHIMNDQSPFEPALRAHLTNTTRAEELDRTTRLNYENMKHDHPKYTKDLADKQAYQSMTEKWECFRKYAKAPAFTHADDWPLRMKRMELISKAVERLDRGFFARRQSDREEIWRLEDQVRKVSAPTTSISGYEAIVQSWCHHAAIVSHFGRSSVKYTVDAHDQPSKIPTYTVPYDANTEWVQEVKQIEALMSSLRGTLSKCQELYEQRTRSAASSQTPKSKGEKGLIEQEWDRGRQKHPDEGPTSKRPRQKGESHRQPRPPAPIPGKMNHAQKTRQGSLEPIDSRQETTTSTHDRSAEIQSDPPSPTSEDGVRTAEDPSPAEEEQDWNWKTVNDPAAPSQWSTYWKKRTAVCESAFGKLDPKILKRADVIRTKRSQKIKPKETAEALSRFHDLTKYLATVLSDDMKCEQRAIQTLALWCPSVNQWNTTSRTILEAESGQAEKVKPTPDPRTMPSEANHRKKEEASKLDTKVGTKSPTRTGRGGEEDMDGYSPVNKTHGSEADVRSEVSGGKGRNADRSPRGRGRDVDIDSVDPGGDETESEAEDTAVSSTLPDNGHPRARGGQQKPGQRPSPDDHKPSKSDSARETLQGKWNDAIKRRVDAEWVQWNATGPDVRTAKGEFTKALKRREDHWRSQITTEYLKMSSAQEVEERKAFNTVTADILKVANALPGDDAPEASSQNRQAKKDPSDTQTRKTENPPDAPRDRTPDSRNDPEDPPSSPDDDSQERDTARFNELWNRETQARKGLAEWEGRILDTEKSLKGSKTEGHKAHRDRFLEMDTGVFESKMKKYKGLVEALERRVTGKEAKKDEERNQPDKALHRNKEPSPDLNLKNGGVSGKIGPKDKAARVESETGEEPRGAPPLSADIAERISHNSSPNWVPPGKNSRRQDSSDEDLFQDSDDESIPQGQGDVSPTSSMGGEFTEPEPRGRKGTRPDDGDVNPGARPSRNDPSKKGKRAGFGDEQPEEVLHQTRERDSYPPKGGRRTTKSSEPRSWYNIAPFFSSLSLHVRTSKTLSIIFVLYTCAFVFFARQITVLVTLPPGSSTSSNLAKRGSTNLPPDLALTQDWLIKMLGGTVDPGMAMIFLFVWIGLGMLMFGVLYNAICEAVDRPHKELTEEEREANGKKWYRSPRKAGRVIWRGLRSFLVGTAKVILLDRHPSIGQFWKRRGWWTALRITIFLAQLVLSVILLRQSIALASLVAGVSEPAVSGFDIELTASFLKGTAPQMGIDGTMLLLLTLLGSIILVLAIGWYSLLHPRKKDENANAMRTIGRIVTCRAFGKMSGGAYQIMVAVVAIVLVMTFAACVVYFSEIIAYTASNSYVKTAGFSDSIGLIGASLIFGLFALPLAWIYIQAERLAIRMYRKRRDKNGDE